MLKIFDLFAGVGGFRLGSSIFNKHRINYKFVGWSEVDKYCRISYKSNFNVINDFFIDDIKKVTNTEYIKSIDYNNEGLKNNILSNIPKFNLLFAGFPCQSFSNMGNKKRLEDPRGNLFYDIAAVLAAIKPEYIVLENVRKIITLDNGNVLKKIMSTLNQLGYQVDYIVLNSKDFGIPQNRSRVFFYGFKKELELSMPLFEPKKEPLKISTKDILDIKVNQKYTLSEKILKTIMKHGTGGYYQKSEIDLKIARPLTRTMAKMHRANQDNYYSNKFILGEKKIKWVRRLTPTEAFKLQGFKINFVENCIKNGISDTQLYMQAGNTVTVNVVKALLEWLINNNWFKKL